MFRGIRLGRVSKYSFQPIEDGGEEDEVEKMEVGLFIARADAAMAFDAVPPPVVASMMRGRGTPSSAGRDAYAPAHRGDVRAQLVTVLAFVTHHLFAGREHLVFSGDHVGSLARGQRQLQRATLGIHARGQLGVESAFGATDGLILLATRRVARILMHLDVRRVQTFERSVGLLGQQIQNLRPEQRLAPASPARVNRTPRSEVQITPRTTGAQHMNERFDHVPVIFGRPPAAGPRTITRSRLSKLIFLSAPRVDPRGRTERIFSSDAREQTSARADLFNGKMILKTRPNVFLSAGVSECSSCNRR